MAIIIDTDLTDGTAPLDYPLTHARWFYKRVSGTVSASSETAGNPAIAANNPLTYTFWRPASPTATWTIETPAPEDVDYCAIAAHTLATNGSTVTVQRWDGSAFVDILTMAPTDNSPLIFYFAEVQSDRFRVSITGATAPRLGVIWFGKATSMERPIYGGHSPITLSRSTILSNNVSERGQWLGRSIVRGGSATSFTWQNLTAAWYRSDFDPLVEHLRTEPAFIAWRPASFPQETAYVWTNQDIQPTNAGRRDLMSVTVQVEGLGIE